ncbi:MAG: ABC-type amino acid transport system, permease component [Rhodospirillales bacterium]|nr:ABC-type amino acid transport system, permease component [Rhodospirillales bacterium]
MYQWDFGSLWAYRSLVGVGLGYTVGYTILCVTLGLIVGTAAGLGRLAKSRFATWPLIFYIEVFRCTPLLVQLVWFYYALPVLLDISMSPALAATLTLSLYGGAFYAEIVRAGVLSIDAGQWDAGKALGLSRLKLMRKIILPQALKRMLPPLMNQSIIQLKNTSLVSVLAVPDLLYQGQVVTAAIYRPLEVYTMVALIYFAVLFPLTLAVQGLERRLAAHA